MSPKKATDIVTGYVDGVHYHHNRRTNLLVVGTGLMSNNERDVFRPRADAPLEQQMRARPKWKAMAEAAMAAEAAAACDSGDVQQQQPSASELADEPQPGSHGKAHHTPVSIAGEPPAKHAATERLSRSSRSWS